ncbi:MAG: hypothetical protein J5732_01690 [Bacteroidaceae bacterium]|nr:hypothetical protein [Bacteroidaceae bacterium]
MKHAYLIIAHNEFEVLQLLLKAIDDVRNDIYVHIDKKVKVLPKLSVNYSKLYVLEKRIDVRWGHVSQIKTELLLFETALENGLYEYYHLISGTHLPLKNQNEIHSFFDSVKGCEVMRLWSLDKGDADFKLRRYHFFTKNNNSKNKLTRWFSHNLWLMATRIQIILGIRHLSNLKPVKSDNWKSLTHIAARFLVDNKKSIIKKYRWSYCGDEYYAATELSARQKLFNIIDYYKLLYVEFDNANPKVLSIGDFEVIKASDCLFARKFSLFDTHSLGKNTKYCINKESLRNIAPQLLWTYFRKQSIIIVQNRVGKLCDRFNENYYAEGQQLFTCNRKKNLSGKKVIWQYWAQGFEGELPEVVKVCLASVDKYKGNYEVIRLSDKTISEYVDLPDFVWEKRRNGWSIAFFSDVLRLALLYVYGGVWLDATILLTEPIPDRYSTYDFFMFQRDENEKNKKYWENSYAYYFGWSKNFKVRVLNSIIFAKAENRFLCDYLNLMLCIWKNCEVYPYYFTTQIMFNQLLSSGKTVLDCPVENDCLPHYLMQIINGDFPYATVEETCNLCSMHKLTYKDINMSKFREIQRLLS